MRATLRTTPLHDAESLQISDHDLLRLFRARPRQAWQVFLDRYAGRILGQLRGLGLDLDDSMECFVYVCERLAEDRFRRLRQVQRTGQRGELVPWLRQVVKHAAIDWGWTRDGRQRLLRCVAQLGNLDQRVFQLHFWHGLGPAAILEALHVEGAYQPRPEQVFDALERVLKQLDAGQRWRLLSQLSRRRDAQPIGTRGNGEDSPWEPASDRPDPEAQLLRSEQTRVAERALSELATRDRLIFRLRYEDGLTLAEMAAIVGLGLTTIKASLRQSRERLRAACKEVTP